MTSTCTDVGGRGEWVPDPAQLICRAPGRSDRYLYIHLLRVLVECAYSRLVNQFMFSQSIADFQISGSLNMDL